MESTTPNGAQPPAERNGASDASQSDGSEPSPNAPPLLTRALIERALEVDEWRYSIDDEGDVCVQMAYDEEIDCQLTHYFMVTGSEQNLMQAYTFCDRRIRRRHWQRTLEWCNQWNREKMLPKVYLSIEDPEQSTFGRVVCEMTVPTSGPQTLENVRRWCIWQITMARTFWEWHLQHEEAAARSGDGDAAGDTSEDEHPQADDA